MSLHEHGVLAAIHPALGFAPEHADAFARLRDLHATGARAAYWPVLAWRLTEGEILEFCFLLILAGNETTRNGISGGLEALCAHPTERARLQADMS
jgi:cytochrome P450